MDAKTTEKGKDNIQGKDKIRHRKGRGPTTIRAAIPDRAASPRSR
jgi:hypothetical protein